MKTLIAFLTILMLSSINNSALSQSNNNTESIWVTVDDLTILPSNIGSRLVSYSNKFQEIIDSYNIIKVEQILPDSRKESLLKVYELTCECNADLLMLAIKKNHFELNKPTLAPEYDLLNTPNDYSLTFAQDYALELINAEAAWDITTGDTSVVIGISDSGYDMNHTEFTGTVNYIQPGLAGGNYYHGTAVAITAAGNTNNQIGKSSIGYDCRLQLRNYTYSSILAASYAGARVINVSWSSGCIYNAYFQGVIDEAYNNGSIIITAAGNGTATCNGPSSLVYPAAFNHVISVTSVGPQDNHERYIGDPTSTHQHNATVDISAPGYDVALTVANGLYLTGNGTSFAAPYVSGTVGLMLSINPCLSFEDVKYILEQTAVNIDAANPNYIGGLGAGRLDAHAAVLMASNFQSNPFDLSFETGYGCETSGTLSYSQVEVINETYPATYTVNWSTGSSDFSEEGLENGIYLVEVTNNVGCSVQKEVIINMPEQLSLDIQAIDVNCFGVSDGEINVSILGGTPNYYSDLNVINNEISLVGLAPGTYEISVSDDNNCDVTQLIVISEPLEIEMEIVVSNPSCFGYDNGSISSILSGGNGDFFYSWNNGETGSVLNNIESGNYSLIVSDQNGCTSSSVVFVGEPAVLETEVVISDESAEIFIEGGTPDYSIIWSNGNMSSAVQNLKNGNYTVNVYDANGCQTTEEVIINSTLGTDSFEMIDFSLFPNPTRSVSMLKFETGTLSSVIVFNSVGQNIKKYNELSNDFIEIELFESGVYYVQIQFIDGTQSVEKLVVSK